MLQVVSNAPQVVRECPKVTKIVTQGRQIATRLTITWF